MGSANFWMTMGQSATAVVGAVMDANSQAAGFDQQARAAKRNAAMADAQAGQAYEAGVQNELGQRQANARQQGEIRAAVGESGFDSASGSSLAVQQQAAQDMEMGVLSNRYAALLQGYGYEQQAVMDRYTARVLRKSSKNARKAGWINAATGVLKAVSSNYGGGGMGNMGSWGGGGGGSGGGGASGGAASGGAAAAG